MRVINGITLTEIKRNMGSKNKTPVATIILAIIAGFFVLYVLTPDIIYVLYLLTSIGLWFGMLFLILNATTKWTAKKRLPAYMNLKKSPKING